jgi:uncharacterized protein (TIGR02569 family)
VLAAFGVAGGLKPLAGGRGQSFVGDGVVLKPVGDDVEASWSAEVLAAIEEGGFRVARPVRASNGRWVVDGWAAHEQVAGDHRIRGGPWPEAIAACRSFHRALAGVARPSFVDHRDDIFAVADRAVWGERTVSVAEPLAAMVRDLEALLQPVDSPSQVIHGDVAGNLLFADGAPPAVIDFSPYWRPAGHAVAQVIVDALLWYGADLSLVEAAADIPEIEQFLARALMFRLVLDGLQLQSAPTALFTPDQVTADVDQARPLVGFLREETARRRSGGHRQNGYRADAIG